MTDRSAQPAAPLIGVHLDLKGAVHKPRYFLQVLADLAGQGVNAVLVEYEDVFPFEPPVRVALDRQAVWSKKMLRDFLAEAARLGIEVIPLQQCLGHLQYVFRWPRYRRWSEEDQSLGTLCVSQDKGRAFVFEMLRQVLAAHPESRYVHLGLDEAHKLATCPRCRRRGDTLAVFLAHLNDLCEIVAAAGKTPIIWSDMLENDFEPARFRGLADRIVLMPWDYACAGEFTPFGRMMGWRISRKWLDDPTNLASPAFWPGQKFFEDLPPAARRWVAPHQRGPLVRSAFGADVWTKLGFRVIGGAAIRASAHGPMLPDYCQLRENLRAWARAIRRTGQLGVVATSWARGNTFCPPNFPIEVAWPLVADLVRAFGRRPQPYWPGVPAAELERIVLSLGRCKKEWSIEADLLAALKRLRPKVKAHRYEWDALTLMGEVLALRKRCDRVFAEVDFLTPAPRSPETAWRRSLGNQGGLLKELAELRRRVAKFFSARYAGRGFEEWLDILFGLPVQRLRVCQEITRRAARQAKALYRG